MKINFTPKHWTYDKMGGYIFANELHDGLMVGEVRGWGWLMYKHNHVEDNMVKEQEANGNLMALAPEMFEACMAAVDYLEKNEDISSSKLRNTFSNLKSIFRDRGIIE